ncbi:hypothetical protein SteCoe_37497 [Stentor coeruleus]|uniref:Deacetylase sirtuin-type domain-containing protein n=1 Tax=Stentor coeruleus TaxID=5963 RepID=A0A1R2AMY7_9CILI|nr:hypothetical protein SteCoe_37497 [Stentor coeruleus]
MNITKELLKAKEVIKQCNFLMITAGAGMSVDSGLPDFKGSHSFWEAYPPMKKLALTLPEVSNPLWFHRDPTFAWGFFGHRYHLYKNAIPHEGYNILKKWVKDKKYFVYTSNIDGLFLKTGFPENKVAEFHGTIHYLQCLETYKCSLDIWPMDQPIEYDPVTFRAIEPLPKCKNCGGLARPNINMFGDIGWVSDRSSEQIKNLENTVNESKWKMAVLEIGAGEALYTVRPYCQRLVNREKATLIRINPDKPLMIKDEAIEIHMKALDALKAIDSIMNT